MVAGEYCPEELIETHTYIVGAENGSGDESYSVTEEFMNTVCDIHDENYQPEEPDDPDNPDGEDETGDPDNPDESDNSDNPDEGGESHSSDNPENQDEPDAANADDGADAAADAGLTAFGLWDWFLRLQRRM
jgi:hypothetical protein